MENESETPPSEEKMGVVGWLLAVPIFLLEWAVILCCIAALFDAVNWLLGWKKSSDLLFPLWLTWLLAIPGMMIFMLLERPTRRYARASSSGDSPREESEPNQ